MPVITYVESDGAEHAVDVSEGDSVMEGAVNNGIPGIDADCGGVCACATCHVYIDEKWASILPEVGELEESMLEFAADCLPDSRLSCRLQVGERYQGLVVRMPAAHY